MKKGRFAMVINELEKTDAAGHLAIAADNEEVAKLLESFLAKKETIGFVDSYELHEPISINRSDYYGAYIALSFTAICDLNFENNVIDFRKNLIKKHSNDVKDEEIEYLLSSEWSLLFTYEERFNDICRKHAYLVHNDKGREAEEGLTIHEIQ